MPSTKISREDILHRCWEVIHLHGYKASSVSMLASATGLGKAGLLHHFGSKENLMHAVVDYAVRAYRKYVFAVASEDLPLAQRLEKMLRRQNRLSKLDQRGCFFTNTVIETGQLGLFNERLMAFYDEWQAIFTRLLSEVLPHEEAASEAYSLLIRYKGSVAMYKLNGDKMYLDKFVQRAIASLPQPQRV